MKFLSKLEKSRDVWFLIIVSCIFFLLRLPSLFEPLWYGDEGIYQVIGMGLNQGRLLYRDIWDNKPPLIYLLYAIFQANQPIIRLVSIVFGLVSVILFYFLAKKLFHKQRQKYITTSIFAFMLAIPLLEGNIANAENFMMPLILGGALLIYNTVLLKHVPANRQSLSLFLSGLLLGLAFLFKVVAVFDLAAFAVFICFMHLKTMQIQTIKILTREYISLFIGFFLPFFITILYFLIHAALPEFIHSAFLSNVGYVNYGNTFIIPQGLLIIKLALLAFFCLILWKKKKAISPETKFILIWLAFSIFSALFSQRPYTHYLLVLLSSFCLFIGVILEKTKSQLLLIGAFFLLSLYLLSTFSFYTKGIGYYMNFISFLNSSENTTQYRAFFDSNTPRDYALSDFLNTQLQPNNQVFLWGNDAQFYTLIHKLPPGRYIAEYWIGSTAKTRQDTLQALTKENPRFILIMPNVGKYPYTLHGYTQRLVIDKAIIYEKSI